MKKAADLNLIAWRQKREARREKQRRENLGRALKMRKLRKLHDKDSKKIDSSKDIVGRKAFCVGCSGWFYWHWRGLFYPAGLLPNRWFDHYAKRFDTVELNAPFYSWPTAGTVKSWARQVGRKKFIYTIKVCELITHVRRFRGTKELIRDFGYIAEILGPRFGCFLFQLPPSDHYTPARLRLILSQLDHSRRNVVEFRDASWWNSAVYRAFRTNGTIFCSCSGPKLPATLVKTSDQVYVRFHGVKRWYRHDYTEAELAEWADKIRKSDAKRVWAYFNNDREGHALKNARELLKLLQKPEPPA